MALQGLGTASSSTPVYYSCGTCGYELNLNSDNRSTSLIDTNYEKMIRRGILTFFSIDETRFTRIQHLKWTPYLASKRSWWRLFRSQTKLLCRNCSSYIGDARANNRGRPSVVGRDEVYSTLALDGFCDDRVYDIKIRTLLPSSSSSKDSCDLAI